MNGRERLTAALRCEAVDELPVILQGLSPYAPSRPYRDRSWDELFDRYAATGDIFHFFAPTLIPPVDPPVRKKVESLQKTADYEDLRITYQTPAGDLTAIRRDQIFTGATLEHAVKSTADLPAARWLLSRESAVDGHATLETYEDLLRHPHLMPCCRSPNRSKMWSTGTRSASSID